MLRIMTVALGATLLLQGCDRIPETTTRFGQKDKMASTPDGSIQRFKYVVEVDTPKGLVTGHSVIGMRVDCSWGLNGKQCASSEISEAAVVELPNGKRLYSLLTNHSQPQWVCCGPHMAWKPGHSAAYKEYLPDMLPDLVVFDDENVPGSVHVVDGTKTFADGYSIRRIYVAETSDELTHKIPNLLPWIVNLDGRLCKCGFGRNDGPDPERFGKFSFMEKDNA